MMSTDHSSSGLVFMTWMQTFLIEVSSTITWVLVALVYFGDVSVILTNGGISTLMSTLAEADEVLVAVWLWARNGRQARKRAKMRRTDFTTVSLRNDEICIVLLNHKKVKAVASIMRNLLSNDAYTSSGIKQYNLFPNMQGPNVLLSKFW